MGDLFKQYAWAMQCVFVLFLAYFLAKIANVYVASLLEMPRSIAVVSTKANVATIAGIGELADFQVIIERNIFDATTIEVKTEPCEPGDDRPECQQQNQVANVPAGEAIKTALPIKVLATIAIGEGRDDRSSAIVDAGSGKGVDVFAVRDPEKTFAPNAVLVQVKPKRIEFLHNNRLEYADLAEELGPNLFVPPEQLAKGAATPAAASGVPTGEQVTQVGDGKFVVNQAEIDAALGNLDQLYTQIRAVPNFEGGQVKGMRVLSIKPGSLFAKLGLQRGDVLDRINGQQIDIKSGFGLFMQLREQKAFTLDLVRGGKTETVEYEIR